MFFKAKKAQGITVKGFYKHIYGLPIPENAATNITSYPDKYEFMYGTEKVTLDKQKVTGVHITTDKQIQKSYVSSVGGAAGGAALFGTLGAMIGGRVQEKTSKIISSYLIFSYKKDENDEVQFIGFDITGNTLAANKFVQEYYKAHPNVTEVQL